MSQPTPPQRELVYCHRCENEWYRDENGIICPECQSDFTECIEPDHDPRQIHEEDLAPDPDEDDIDQFEWTINGAGQPPGGHLHGHVRRTVTLGPGQGIGGAAGEGLFEVLGPAIDGLLRSALGNPRQAPQGAERDEMGNMARPETVTGSSEPEQQRGSGRTVSGSGPGFAYTITSTTDLRPPDAGVQQPVQAGPAEIGTMVQRMMASMGVAPIHGAAGHPPVVAMGLHGQPMAIQDLLAMFGGPGFDGMHGDAVYSQQHLDQIITQLAEQHAAEQAPPRASDEAIEALPRRKICEEDFGDAGQAECSICIGKVDLGEDVTVLPCKHWFHHDCVKPWLETHDTCPHCRKGIMPKDDASGNVPRDANQAPNHDQNVPATQRPSIMGIFNQMREAFAPGSSNPPTRGGSNSGNDTAGASPDNVE